MKICEKCGAYNKDNKKFCIDCGESLGEKLSATEEEKIRKITGEKMEKLYNKKDPLYVSLFDKIMGVISSVGLVTTIIFIAVCWYKSMQCPFLLYAVVFFALAVLDAFVPRIAWSFEKFRIGFSANGADELEPGVFYLWSRRIGIALFTVIGFIMFFASF